MFVWSGGGDSTALFEIDEGKLVVIIWVQYILWERGSSRLKDDKVLPRSSNRGAHGGKISRQSDGAQIQKLETRARKKPTRR